MLNERKFSTLNEEIKAKSKYKFSSLHLLSYNISKTLKC